MIVREERRIKGREVVLHFDTEQQAYLVSKDAMEGFLKCFKKVASNDGIDIDSKRFLDVDRCVKHLEGIMQDAPDEYKDYFQTLINEINSEYNFQSMMEG